MREEVEYTNEVSLREKDVSWEDKGRRRTLVVEGRESKTWSRWLGRETASRGTWADSWKIEGGYSAWLGCLVRGTVSQKPPLTTKVWNNVFCFSKSSEGRIEVKERRKDSGRTSLKKKIKKFKSSRRFNCFRQKYFVKSFFVKFAIFVWSPDPCG